MRDFTSKLKFPVEHTLQCLSTFYINPRRGSIGDGQKHEYRSSPGLIVGLNNMSQSAKLYQMSGYWFTRRVGSQGGAQGISLDLLRVVPCYNGV